MTTPVVAAIGSCAITMTVGAAGTTAVMLNAVIFGLTTFPIYSVAAAHAHDFADSSERVELSAALMFFYALGAISAPLLASRLMTTFGPAALFAMIAAGHAILVVFGLLRMQARPTRAERTPYVYAPRTSFTVGRLLKRIRDRKDPP